MYGDDIHSANKKPHKRRDSLNLKRRFEIDHFSLMIENQPNPYDF